MSTKGPEAAWSRRSWNRIVSKKHLAELREFLDRNFLLREQGEPPSVSPGVFEPKSPARLSRSSKPRSPRAE
jgi:hypothetical protein